MNLRKILIFSVACFIGVGLVPLQAQQVTMTLSESITYALENNIDVKNAQLETLISRATIGEQRSQGLPQINSTLELTKNVQPPLIILPAEAGSVIGGGGGDGGGNGGGAPPPDDTPSDITVIPFAVNFQSSLTTTVEQMIFNGSYFVGLKAAKTLKELTDYDKEKAELDVTEAVKKAYFTVLVNEERSRLVAANMERLDQLLEETTALFEEGFVEKLDVSRIRVQLNNLQTDYDKATTATEVSKYLLKIQMGMPLELELVLEESLQEYSNDDNGFYSTLEAEMLNRVEISQLEKNIELATLDLKNNQVQYIPNFSAFGTYQRVTGAQDFGNVFQADRWFSTSFVGLRLTIPIFDGLRKSYVIQSNRLQIKQLENAKFNTIQNIKLEEYQAKATLKNSLKALEVQKENRVLAKEVFDMTNIKYQEGVGSNLEVVEADAALKEAETNYYAALYDALIAKVDLEKALGILK
ncbi:TolC family protein [Cyclobacterium roseum]|uniref:TolC family protein n=1 Tax=Cyclobacterium roseum TaxID=2666137 RepID=UPI0013918896|nr:TolC family protein [Cyclobacterium roseum]